MARVEWASGWEEKINHAVHEYVEILAKRVYANALENCPVDTGALLEDLDYEVHGDEARIGAQSVYYAIYVEEGTRPHPIYPDTKEALWWPGLSHPVPMVNHPGTTATHFLRRALYESAEG